MKPLFIVIFYITFQYETLSYDYFFSFALTNLFLYPPPLSPESVCGGGSQRVSSWVVSQSGGVATPPAGGFTNGIQWDVLGRSVACLDDPW